MFSRDLPSAGKRVGRRGGGGGGGGGRSDGGRSSDSRSEVVEKARRERAERQRLRECSGSVVCIQRWIRGRRAAKAYLNSLRNDLEKKVRDYLALRQALLANGVPCSPPLGFVLSAMQQLLVFYSAGSDDARLCSFATELMLPSLANHDSQTNVAMHIIASAEPSLQYRLKKILSVCLDFVTRNKELGMAEGNSPLKVLLVLAGGGACLTDTSGGIIGDMASAYDVLVKSGVTQMCLEHLLSDQLHLLKGLRSVILGGGKEAELVGLTLGGRSRPPHVSRGRMAAMGGCWELAVSATLASRHVLQEPVSEAIRADFVATMLSVPLASLSFPPELLKRFIGLLPSPSATQQQSNSTKFNFNFNSSLYLDCLKAYATLRPPPPASPTNCCTSTTFLLGNIAELNTKLPADALSLTEQMALMHLLVSLFGDREQVPEAIFSDRQAITWRSSGGGGSGGGGNASNMVAVAVPEEVQRQVRLLVSDVQVRVMVCRLLQDIDDGVLADMTPDDSAAAKAIAESSAATLTVASVQQQRVAENEWFGASWAKKLKKKWLDTTLTASSNSASTSTSTSISTASSAEAPAQSSGRALKRRGSGLLDSSAASRAAAKFGLTTTKSESSQKDTKPAKLLITSSSTPAADVDVAPGVFMLSEFIGTLLYRFEGGGGSGGGSGGANRRNSVVESMLNTLCFSTFIVRSLWVFLQSDDLLTKFARNAVIRESRPTGVHAVVAVFAATYSHMLVVLDDNEMYHDGFPLPLHQVRRVIVTLKALAFRGCWQEAGGGDADGQPTPSSFGVYLLAVMERLLRGLHDRSSRRPLCPPEDWQVGDESRAIVAEVKAQTPRASNLLTAMPFVLPLMERLWIFEHFVAVDKAIHQPPNSPGVPIRIRRGALLEDGLATLNKTDGLLKKRLRVIYISEAGHEEAGIDMGGLFKDFWTDLSALAFDLVFGLFATTSTGLYYPSALSAVIHGPQHLQLFEFLGRILGKALYEGITVQPEFATFFLARLRGHYNYLNMFHDLASLDQDMYKNLMFLKGADREVAAGADTGTGAASFSVEDLSLTFTVTEEEFGVVREIELIPGGANVDVTAKNKLSYINRVAKYHLVDKHKAQAESFTRGLWSVIPPHWLYMFNEPELQVLISGSNKSLDVQDLRSHTRYSGGFFPMDKHVRRFWNILCGMTTKEQAALLRFVTSCERPPPLGFESLQPPFCLHRVGVSTDDDRLPTASTCFNTLKLPTYSSEKVMRAKLLTSITSGAGFELS